MCSIENTARQWFASLVTAWCLVPGMTFLERDFMNSTELNRAEIDTGRKLFNGHLQIAAAGSTASLPPMKGVEIAFRPLKKT